MFISENLKNIKNTIKITCYQNGLRYLFMFGYIFLKCPLLPITICMHAFICDYMLLKPNVHVNV